ncbi:hypothetical protein [Pseudaestuariivita atlantica]|uniref:Lipoprotein n=1 Tax=Pseudaestuariivita atlantica TaxID=1317121 RepID=A0A0L1JPF4_9RHOB|nr:hypothetical protein [Pseudaestuariivita atlantica]KNG93592.1 hypothetical protein ATO11_10285 [Pseudaestuariivita atlantica]
MRLRLALFTLVMVFVAACEPLISPYRETAYQNATTLKARSAALVAKASDPYPQHRTEAEALLVAVDAAYEYSRGLPRNEVSAKQWDIMRDPNGNLLGGFIGRWRDKGRLNPFVRDEGAELIAEGFDTIICVEINKRAADSCTN